MDDELRHHIERLTQQKIRDGLTPESARTAALLEFGGVEQTKEECRDVNAIDWLENGWRDVRFALRQLRRSPVFTVTAVVTLALGIGASAAMFSVVNGVLLRPLPYAEADQLVLIRSRDSQRDRDVDVVSIMDVSDWRTSCRSFDELALYAWESIDLPSDGAGVQRVDGLAVSPEFFSVVGLGPSVGRVISQEECDTHERVVILSGRIWRQRYAGDPDLVGRSIEIHSWRSYPEVGAKPYRVVGIIDQESRFLPTVAGFDAQPIGVDQQVDFWMPVRLRDDDYEHREWREAYRCVGRLSHGVTIKQAQDELHRVCSHLATEYPDTNKGWTARVLPLEQTIVGDVRSTIWLLSGAIGFLLLVSLANVASLLLVRGVRRRHEFSIRSALGADRWRLIRQLIAESLALGLISGVFSIGVAVGGVILLRRLAPPQLPRIENVTIDGTALATSLLIALLTGLCVGIVPAWLASRTDIHSTLNSAERTGSTGRSGRWLLKFLAGGSVALAVVLLIGAGLLQQSLAKLLKTDIGFNREKLLTMELSLPFAAHQWDWNTKFCHDAVERVQSVPGVESVGAIRGVPLEPANFYTHVFAQGSAEIPFDENPKVRIRVIGPGYINAMKIPLLEGRLFERRDDEGEIGYAKTTLINQAAADMLWPGESAVGKRMRLASESVGWTEVVGVVGNVRYAGLKEGIEPEVYYPDALFPQTDYSLVIRTNREPLSLSRSIEHTIREIDSDVLITNIRTMNRVVTDSVADLRFAAVLLTTFSIVALVIAIVGNYGVIANSVAQRRRDIGIRLAMGAGPHRILLTVLREELLTSLTGLAVGVLLSLAGTRILQGFLYGIPATHPPTYLAITFLMLMVTTLAAMIPAWPASRMNPMNVLREE